MSPGPSQKDLLDTLEMPAVNFSDPALAILSQRKGSRAKRQVSSQELVKKLKVERSDIGMEAEIEQDPVTFMRKQLTRMLSYEISVNEALYQQATPNPKEVSESNKRIIDLGNALKALPNQTDSAALGAARSSAELIMEAMLTPDDDVAPIVEIDREMLDRADACFGEGAVE